LIKFASKIFNIHLVLLNRMFHGVLIMQVSTDPTSNTDSYPFKFLCESIHESFKASLIYIGEGLNGEFQTNSNDIPLLRLEAFELLDGKWELIEDGSICTQLSLNDQPDDLKAFVGKIAKNLSTNSSRSPRESIRTYLEEACFNPFSLIQN